MEPQVQYATTGDGVNIAYYSMGHGRPLVFMRTFDSHVVAEWNYLGRLYEAIMRGSILVRYDHRGLGLSDRKVKDFSLGAMVQDIEAVVDRLDLRRFNLVAFGIGAAPIGITYAVRHPHRVFHLVITPGLAHVPEVTREQMEMVVGTGKKNWVFATEAFTRFHLGWDTEEISRGMAELLRKAVTFETLRKFVQALKEWDATDLLPKLTVPTLVVADAVDIRTVGIETIRDFAAALPTGQLVVIEATDQRQRWEKVASAVTRFLSEGRVPEFKIWEPEASPAARVRSILFTDIVGHTEMMSRLGDQRGRDVLREHERITREVLKAHGGTEVKTMGDGFLASFGSVTKAVECAVALQRAFEERNRSLPAHPEPAWPERSRRVEGRAEYSGRAPVLRPSSGQASAGSASAGKSDPSTAAAPRSGRTDAEPIGIRVGLNAGEPIEEEGDLFGATVILASRIAAKAEGGEILASDVVRGLCSGKGFLFADRGDFLAKGFEEPVRVFEVRWRPFDSSAGADGSG